MSYFNKFGFYDGSTNESTGSSYVLPSTVVQNSGGSSVDNAIVRFDGTSGNKTQNSGITINDTNDITGANSIAIRPATNQAILLGRTTTDINERIQLHTTNGLQLGGGATVPDVRFYRDSASSVILDNGSASACNFRIIGTLNAGDITSPTSSIAFNSKSLTSIGTGITSSAALTISTASNGALSLTANGSGNVILSSTTGNIQINRPITTTLIEQQLTPAAGWGRHRFSNGATTGNITLETGTSLAGYQAITFNGYSDGTEQRYNTGKRRWRNMVFQNAAADNYTIDSFDGTTQRQHIFIDPSASEQVSFPLGLRTGTIATASGDLTLVPAGSNIVCSSKNLINVASIQTSSIITSSGDISINPAGSSINMNSKTVNNVINLFTTNNTTIVGAPKIRLFQSGADIYGFGIQSNVMSYEATPSGSNHVFFVTNTERLRISATALQLSVPITTASGNLVLNPAGSSIDFSNKTITNAVFSGSSLTSGPTATSSGSWSGTFNVRIARTGNVCVLTISGGCTATTLTNVWSNLSAIPVGFRPVSDMSIIAPNSLNDLLLRFFVGTGGTVSIQKHPTSNWAINDVLNVEMSISYIV